MTGTVSKETVELRWWRSDAQFFTTKQADKGEKISKPLSSVSPSLGRMRKTIFSIFYSFCHKTWVYLALLTGMGLTLWLRNGDITSRNWGSLGGSTGVSDGSIGCFFFFCRMSFQRGICTGGGGGTKGQSLIMVSIMECGWLCDKPAWRSLSDASAYDRMTEKDGQRLTYVVKSFSNSQQKGL